MMMITIMITILMIRSFAGPGHEEQSWSFEGIMIIPVQSSSSLILRLKNHHDYLDDHDYHDDKTFDICRGRPCTILLLPSGPPAPPSTCLVSHLTYSSLTVRNMIVRLMIMTIIVLKTIMILTGDLRACFWPPFGWAGPWGNNEDYQCSFGLAF